MTSKDGLFKTNKAGKQLQRESTAEASKLAETIWGIPDNTPNDGPKRTAQVNGELLVEHQGATKKATFSFVGTYSDEYTKIAGYANETEMRQGIARLIQSAFRKLAEPEATMVALTFIMTDGKAPATAIDYDVTGSCSGDNISVDFRWGSGEDNMQEETVNLNMHRDN